MLQCSLLCSRWGKDKSEDVHGQDCKVFAANSVEIVTKTRTEHMSQEDRDRARANKNPLLSFLGPQDVETEVEQVTEDEIVLVEERVAGLIISDLDIDEGLEPAGFEVE